jgi:phage protein U
MTPITLIIILGVIAVGFFVIDRLNQRRADKSAENSGRPRRSELKDIEWRLGSIEQRLDRMERNIHAIYLSCTKKTHQD